MTVRRKGFMQFFVTVLAWCWLGRTALAIEMAPNAENLTKNTGFNLSAPYITIGFHVPPATVTIADAQGRIDGVDTTKPLNAVGIGTVLAGIPGSQVDQSNISSDDPATLGEENPQTLWGVDLQTATAQTYVIRLKGLMDGVEVIGFGGNDPNATPAAITPSILNYSSLVSAGATRTLRLAFDPIGHSAIMTRVVQPSDLSSDVATACRLGMIAPSGMCQSLEAKAKASAAALKRGNKKAAVAELGAFLDELRAQGDHHIKEPALTILREEAEALVAKISAPVPGKSQLRY